MNSPAISLFWEERVLERKIMIGVAAGLLAGVLAGGACAQAVIKVGAVLSMTGPFGTNGRDVMAGAQLYLQQHGDTVAGKQIKIILKDDASAPDVARRAAQELIVNEKVGVLIAGISPAALSIAALSTEAKIATVVAISGTSVVMERSPYMVRSSFMLGQSSSVIADWAVKNGAKKIVTLVADFAPGQEAERAFNDVAVKDGAQILASLRVPLDNADFAPFLQRARDLAPDTLFAFVPNHQASPLVKQFLERGMDKSGIRFVATGDLTPDDDLPNMTDAMLGVVTAHHYSANHNSALNKEFVAAYEKANQPAPDISFARRLRRHAPDHRGAQEDRRQDRRRRPDSGDEGHEVGKPARTDLDRSGNARHRPERIHPQGREGERREVQRRIRHHRGGEGSPARRQEVARGREGVGAGVAARGRRAPFTCVNCGTPSSIGWCRSAISRCRWCGPRCRRRTA